MQTKNDSTNLSPARIYVLWHPDFDRPDLKARDPATLTEDEKNAIDRGLCLARRIYYWFRLEDMEGIPVYFRSTNALEENQPLPIEDDSQINYVIPLIDANMVSSPGWRDYVAKVVGKSVTKQNGCTTRVFPAAVDPVAYNMPECMRRLNFIRHNLSSKPPPDDGALIGQLTEVLCRDMQARVKDASNTASVAVPGKLKIFLSHAKADDTKEAIELKHYIQSQTQCEAFFDETDIASGYDYSNVLETAITEDSAGLVVVQGDHYADRPWCRKEIRDFLKPVPDKMVSIGTARAFFIPPVIVVQTMKGNQMARTIPELGHAPCVLWRENKSHFIIRTLLREILLGLFYRLVGKSVVNNAGPACVVINRTPDPVMVNRILSEIARDDQPDPKTIIHPGYGLSSMELEGLKISFPNLLFKSFSEVSVPEPKVSPRNSAPYGDFHLKGKVLAVSAGNAQDALDFGLGDEHNQELLVRLLRPLLRKQASLLYGGRPPMATPSEEPPWRTTLQFTGAFLHLLLSERSAKQAGQPFSSRLYNLSAWPGNLEITRQAIAQWTDICSFIPLGEKESGIKAMIPAPRLVAPQGDEYTTPTQKRKLRDDHAKALATHKAQYVATQARCLTDMRFKACREIQCTLPDKPSDGVQQFAFKAFAHLFVGGKTAHASGIIPGLFEEILYALEAKRPVFIIGQSCGAAGLIARWFSIGKTLNRPRELIVEYYLSPDKKENYFSIIRAELKKLQALSRKNKTPVGCILTPDEAFKRLWNLIENAWAIGDLKTVFNNGLNHKENLNLLTSGSCAEICRLVWEGIARLQPDTPKITSADSAKRKKNQG